MYLAHSKVLRHVTHRTKRRYSRHFSSPVRRIGWAMDGWVVVRMSMRLHEARRFGALRIKSELLK